MVTVYSIRRHHAGFGMFKRDCEGQEFPGLETVDDYVSWVRQEDTGLEPVAEGDEGYDKVRAADGATYDQNGGTILGWRDRDGYVGLEVVYEEKGA